MEATDGQDRTATSRAGDALLWGALFVALSPTLSDLAGHWGTNPWSRYSLGFVPLLALAARALPGDARWRDAAFWTLVVCVVGQFGAGFVAARPVARPLAGLAVAAFLVHRGTTTPRAALLALWIVPVPSMIVVDQLDGRAVAAGLAEGVAALLRATGTAVEAVRGDVRGASGQLAIPAYWSGLVLAFQALGLAWFTAARLRLGVRATMLALAAAAALAFPLQLAIATAAGALALTGNEGAATRVLEPGSWLVALIAGLVVTQVVLRRRARTAAATTS